MYKLELSNKKSKYNGECASSDRTRSGKITIYKNAENPLETLIHETIHSFLIEEKKKSAYSRVLHKLNNNEPFIERLTNTILNSLNEFNKQNE